MTSQGVRAPRILRRGVATAAAALTVLALSPAVATAAPDDQGATSSSSGFALTPSSAVLVHGTNLAAAQAAVAAAGLTTVDTYDKVGVVAAAGSPAQIEAARRAPGVTHIEANTPIELFSETSHTASRGKEAREQLRGANGALLDGTGVTVAIIDSGIDPTHPAFSGGKVVRNLRAVCLLEEDPGTGCVLDVPRNVDTDTTAGGGHGTHVSGIAAGNINTIEGGDVVSGAAPGSKIISISTGAVLFIIGADSALNWVLENHANPCAGCPPIKAINNSYGPSGGGSFDPNSATVKIQRQLAAEGVVTVWAAGNDGGDGSESLTNPAGQDPTPGVISVASYFDQNTGTRDGAVSTYSSRGLSTNAQTWPDISAPGEDITQACRPYLPVCSTGLDPKNGPGTLDIGTYNTISGTSMAAPHITGIVAQLFQANPTATPAQVEAALKSTAYRYVSGSPYVTQGDYLTSFDKGVGLVDVFRAAKALGARNAYS